MNIIQPEIFETFINNGHFEINDAGPLHTPVNGGLKIKRDKKLNLVITTTSEVNAPSNSIEHPLGTVLINTDSLEMTCISSCKVKMNGIQRFSSTTTTDLNGNSTRTEESFIESVSSVIRADLSAKYIIEWLENVDDQFYGWPDSVETVIQNRTIKTYGRGENQVEMRGESTSEGSGMYCIHLQIDEYEFYLVSSNEDKHSVGVGSGYIIYIGTPCCEIRKKIRDCLSFILGRPLIEMGHSVFDCNWELIEFKSISAYSMEGSAFSISSMPPAPLYKKYDRWLDSDVINPLVNSIFKNYDKYRFRSLSWAYWHAITASSHIAAVHFGACIESLQKSYIDNNKSIFKKSLLERSQWKILRIGSLDVLNSLDLTQTERKVLENKINSLNQCPQSILTDRFLDSLDISFSTVEKEAWQQRNNAAHGKEIEESERIKLIRELKILKVIFHRVLLRITIKNVQYIDYYSLGHPQKWVTNSIEDNA